MNLPFDYVEYLRCVDSTPIRPTSCASNAPSYFRPAADLSSNTADSEFCLALIQGSSKDYSDCLSEYEYLRSSRKENSQSFVSSFADTYDPNFTTDSAAMSRQDHRWSLQSDTDTSLAHSQAQGLGLYTLDREALANGIYNSAHMPSLSQASTSAFPSSTFSETPSFPSTLSLLSLTLAYPSTCNDIPSTTSPNDASTWQNPIRIDKYMRPFMSASNSFPPSVQALGTPQISNAFTPPHLHRPITAISDQSGRVETNSSPHARYMDSESVNHHSHAYQHLGQRFQSHDHIAQLPAQCQETPDPSPQQLVGKVGDQKAKASKVSTIASVLGHFSSSSIALIKVPALEGAACQHCSHQYSDYHDMLSHQGKHGQVLVPLRAHRCPVPECPMSVLGFEKRANLRHHVVADHFSKGYIRHDDGGAARRVQSQLHLTIYICDQDKCGKAFYRRDSLTRHVRLVHSNARSLFNAHKPKQEHRK